MNRKKILYVITKANWGGAQRYVFDLATNLPKGKFEAVVALGQGKILKEKLSENNIIVIRLKHSQRNINPFKDFFLFFELLKLYREEKPDIIHLNSSKIGLLGALTARIYSLYPKPHILNPKIIFTAHGWAFNDSNFFLTKTILKFLQWLTVILTDKTIAVSQKAKNDIAKLPFVSSKIEVIYNGIAPINFLPREEARIRLWPGKKENLWVGTLSELNKNKGIDILIEAAEEIIRKNPEVFFIVLGEGEQRAILEKEIRKKGIEKNFILKGFVEKANNYLKSFDIFVLSSRTEGLPYAVLEAGFCGLPIVANKVGGIDEIIDDKISGLLTEKEKPDDLKQKLEFLIGNKEKRKFFGENIQKKILSDFNIKKMTADTISIYDAPKKVEPF